MRGTFIRTLIELAEMDQRIHLLTGDLGFHVVEPFAERFPDRFWNVGVAEQDLIGIASGMAESGMIPFAYSIATFVTLRPYEFIRNGPVHQRLPVRMVGVGGGFEYGELGASHHALEDLGILRMQPGLTVIAPADPAQAGSAVRATWQLPGPVYYRLGKDERASVPGLDGRFELGRTQLVRTGKDALLAATGTAVVEAAAAAELLAAEGLDCAVLAVPVLNPAPVDDLAAHLAGRPFVVAAEDHYATGGLGSLFAEVIADRGLGCRVVRRGVHARPERAGSERWLREGQGLSAEGLAAAVRDARLAA